MAATYDIISATTLSSATTSVVFSNIPQTYTDLVLRISARSTRNATSNNMNMTINNNTTTAYSVGYLNQNATTLAAQTSNGASDAFVGTLQGTTTTANTFTMSEIYIPRYTLTAVKTFSAKTNYENQASTPFEQDLMSEVFTVTDAITSLSLFSGSGSFQFAIDSTFYLYGIKNS